ncbi:YciI family protein [Flavobacterium tistrianum]|uniref:YciI family protein n=1 Tax=Flavobacterium tistrianum TaxID=1685414 RepID=UPI000DAE4F58|nr:YciI family protein [Flavobacterium tistrianum]KAF2339785.1 GTP cyclohydrolase [Flavobacterium tistrianum]
MFVISLTYKKPIEVVERFIQEHILFLEKYYSRNKFICSGRKEPRTGGIILAYNLSKLELLNLLKEDPFYQNQIADYDITEFTPTKFAKDFEHFTEIT